MRSQFFTSLSNDKPKKKKEKKKNDNFLFSKSFKPNDNVAAKQIKNFQN